jgi:hypothetical protein
MPEIRWSVQATDDVAGVAEGMRDAVGLDAADPIALLSESRVRPKC